MIRPYVLAEANWKAVEHTEYQIAILPWGATEAHNYHLPYATDNYEATAVAEESARKSWEVGTKVIVLPTIPFGINTGQLDVKLCMNLNPSTQYAILKDVADVLVRHKVGKLVILNSHGGNNFKTMIRELAIDFPDLYVCSINWWQVGDSKDFFVEPGDHAGELETSVIMHLHPGLVLPLSEAGDGAAKSYKLSGFKEGWVTSQRHWTKVTADTGVGDPQHSAPEKGAAFLDMTTTKISEFLNDLAPLSISELYE